MKIDRHNYEEYFILYMDNELSIDQRRLVEAFILQHPDLKGELDLLLQYKLVPDTAIVFTNKEELMSPPADTREAGVPALITADNYEEWLLLYIDNELSPEQKTRVEQFIAGNPSLKEEFILLQQTRLQAEKIVFRDKAALYRKEERVRQLPVRWWRVAAAAVLLISLGVATAVIVNKKSAVEKGEIVKGDPEKEKTTAPVPVISPAETIIPVNTPVVADNNKQDLSPVIKKQDNNSVAVKEINSAANNKLPVVITPRSIKEEPIAVVDKPTNDLPLPLNNPNINKNNTSNKDIAAVPSEKNKQQGPLTNSVVTSQNPQSSDILTASHKTDDTDLDQPGGKKGKLRGFFRKVTRTFEKRTDIDPADDNKLLVAGLSFKLK